MSEGKSLWETGNDNTSNYIRKFQEYVKKKWLILPSNTQLVERGVKDAKKCTSTNKDDYLSSLLALLRSATVFQFHAHYEKIDENRVMKGNRFMTSGSIGERIDKWTGETENNITRRTRHGSNYISFTIQSVLLRCKSLDSLNTPKLERDKIKECISKKDHRFMTIRDKETLEKYDQPLTSAPRRNTIQNRSGVDHTSTMLGKIRFAQLRTRHSPLVHKEYHA